MSNVFQRTGSLRPGRSVFDLSYDKKFDCDMGQLIPVMCDEVVPGDKWDVANMAVVRFQPLVAPILHEIDMYVHYFFVPYRLLWDEWEDFITGGVDGDLTPVIPRWSPTPVTGNVKGTLWDFLGFPVGIVPLGALPLDFSRRAYNTIFNEYYRDETLVDEVALTNELILNRAWRKDYFTSALLQQQRGTGPAIPVTGYSSAEWQASDFADTTGTVGAAQGFRQDAASDVFYTGSASGAQAQANALAFFNGNVVDLSTATPFDIADFRLAFQIQKWMERNARAGVRYTEFLGAHFGVSPRDDRLQRPEYIGGSKAPVIISEVLQTSSTDETSPQGNLAGHGISISNQFCGSYHAEEYGLIMGIMSIMPKPAYQQGIDRQWLRRTKYDFYFPEFANLSEQAIERAEIFASGVEAENLTVFGYQGRYDEMRVKRNMVCNNMRDTLDYWHLGRQFATYPELNDTFVTCVPRKDVFAVPSEPGLIVSFGNVLRALRPLPIMSEPGLIDHH